MYLLYNNKQKSAVNMEINSATPVDQEKAGTGRRAADDGTSNV